MNRRTVLIGGGSIIAAGAIGSVVVKNQIGSMSGYEELSRAIRNPLGLKSGDRELIRYATLAANGHNTQPWKFRIIKRGFEILPDFTRRTPVVDPDDHHLFASLGCAAENLMIAATAQGRSSVLRFDPTAEGKLIIETSTVGTKEDLLLTAIPKRQSTRCDYNGQLASLADLQRLAASAKVAGVEVVLITDKSNMARVRDLVIAGNSAQMANAAFVAELKQWIRFNPRSAAALRDGLFAGLSGNPTLPSWLGPTMFDIAFKPDTENDKYARQIDSSSGVAIFLAEKNDPEHWVQAGRACQRFALQATALGMKTAFINQPVEESGLRGELASFAGLPGHRPDILMRFGYGPALPMSMRRDVDAVIVS